ncbi:hypothetical protein C8A05DRAFT_39655 [Staphylotrichum tortipilum]|uniref:Uncharacterized protein n=1 Tax=Staphylotrichum tortipilum TaxID=2831512 RepID=A0AAN6RNB0_9PEZI|nr:hypothetical protein C8A05DRAFT_39655 [Staphylotrichum longicolle]
MLMKSLRKWDPTWAEMLNFQLKAGNMKYKNFVTMVATKANEQSMQNLSAITKTKSNNTTGKPEDG